jgi:predicted lipoprotein with Yx(FWY)xxD motif
MLILRRIFLALFVCALAVLALAACAPAATPPTAAPPTAAPPIAATSAPTSAPTTASAASVATTAATSNASTGAVTVKLAQIQGFGLFLTDDAGRTLYEFDNDTKDTSNCAGNCLQNWPPFLVRSLPQAGDRVNASLLSTFTRSDGTMQAEYDGHPLYYYAKDKNPGDVLGHGVGNVWHVLSPRGSPMTNPAPTATKTP